jgi:hypothetical protein
MISDKQKRLCMTFADGKLAEAAPPEWFVKHLEWADSDSDWQGSLLKAGLQSWESFDGTETFEIYKTSNGGFFIDYVDANESAAWIFIARPVDYITFRATMLAPLVMLTMQSDRHVIWRQEREQAFRRG